MKNWILGFVATCLLVPSLVGAAWTPNGVNLSNTQSTASSAFFPQVASDDSLGAIVVWQHGTGFPNYDNVRVCRVGPDGGVRWTTDACNLPAVQKGAVVVEDGSGGAVIVWEDERVTGPGPGIYAQRLDAAGQPQWALNGVRVADVLPWDRSIRIVSDGAGGAFIAWRDERTGNAMPDVYAQRIFADGSTWASPGGIGATSPTHAQYNAELAADGVGGAVVVWDDLDGTAIRAQRFDGAGNLSWGASGLTVASASTAGSIWLPAIAQGDSGSVVVAWIDGSDDTPGAFAQKIDTTATVQWMTGGVNASGPTGVEYVRIAGDDAGGAFLLWVDANPAGPGLKLTHLDASGAASPSAAVSAPNLYVEEPSLVEDGAGGVFAVWRHSPGVLDDIYGQWFAPDLTPRFAADGIVLCDATNQQWYSDLAQSGVGRAVTVWWDERLAVVMDVFAQVMEGNTPPGTNVTVTPVDLTTGTTPVTVTFSDVTSQGETSLTTGPAGPSVPGTFTISGTYYQITTTATFSGLIEICITDSIVVPILDGDYRMLHYDGANWVDITSFLDMFQHTVCGVTTSLSPFVVGYGALPDAVGSGPHRFSLHANVPNPFNPSTTIRYSVPQGGAHVEIAVYDVAGRIVRSLVDERRAAGEWSVQWNGEDQRGRRVASGVYFYRMRAGTFSETRKMVLLK